MNDLIQKLSYIGIVEVCKAGEVFTLLMTGEVLTNAMKVAEIQKIIAEEPDLMDKYPFVEVIKNGEGFLLIILKK